MKESFEVDNLKRKVEDAEMKLITEIKVIISPTWLKQMIAKFYLWNVLHKEPSRPGTDSETVFSPYKLRKQAATELRDLKAELAQKKESAISFLDELETQHGIKEV